MSDAANDLTPARQRLLSELVDEFKLLDRRLVKVTKQVEALAARSEPVRRLMSIPGLGPPEHDGAACSDRRWTKVRVGQRSCGVARPRSAAALDGREDDASGHQEARQCLCSPPACARCAILFRPSRPREGQDRHLAGLPRRRHASKQGHRRREGRKDCPNGGGCAHAPWRDLRTARSCLRMICRL